MIEGKKYYNREDWKAFKEWLIEFLIPCLKIGGFLSIAILVREFLNFSAEKHTYENLLYISFIVLFQPVFVFLLPLFLAIYLFIEDIIKNGLWLKFYIDRFEISYIYKTKTYFYQEIKSIEVEAYEISEFNTFITLLDNSNVFVGHFVDSQFWIDFARLKLLPLKIDWLKSFGFEQIKYVEYLSFVKNKVDNEQKIPLRKWQDYLKTNPNIQLTNQTTFENYKPSEVPEDEITYYYEWKEDNEVIAYLEYFDYSGMIDINIYKEKVNLVDEIKEFLGADLIDNQEVI